VISISACNACNFVLMMQAVRAHMQLEVNRLKWEHAQEISDLQHNAG